VELEPWVLVALAAVGFAAGFVDAIAGGGGLLQLPSVLAAGIPLPHALGVNKVASVCGTGAAVLRYARHGHVRLRAVALPALLAAAGSALGAFGVVSLPPAARPALEVAFAVCFLGLAAWQVSKVLRRARTPRAAVARPALAAAACFAIGGYDGAVGPGTGMFLFWAFSALLAMAPMDATGNVKVANLLSNLGALGALLPAGAVVWAPALAMACGNLLGGETGARTAIRRGATFVRLVTALVSAAVSLWLLWQRIG
jgi:uncharacterized membrane protein YfcA